ncbi:MAG TPA: APC family permease [Candidatus Eremiobacteraceae bacterium]|nr:APC family permease [Candidatus Eremiobacteraceae bacterium]
MTVVAEVSHPGSRAGLARKLNLGNYFALGFGTMIGTGWVVMMDDWLGRGGPVGAMLGFALGGLLLLPVSYVYGEWVKRLPDASGEAAYSAQVFPPWVSYLTGWIMLLAYFIVCPWEAVALGKLLAFLFPGLDRLQLYSVAGQPVFLPRLLLGAALTLFLAWLNYRGIRASATFQNWTTTALLGVFLFLLVISGRSGHPANFRPLFTHAPVVSILLALQIVPYFITGFESVPKVAEESHPGFPPSGFFKAMAMALIIGAGFYVLAVGAVAYISPWQGLLGRRFATAIAFGQGAHSTWIVRLILGVTLVGLLQVFNGNFVAASRLLFAFGRRHTIPSTFAKIHVKYLTPSVAIGGVAGGTLLGLLVGDALLVPVTEVGSMASAFGWLVTCLSFYMVEKGVRLRIVTAAGIVVSLLLVLMKWLPNVPGHFSMAEWVALGGWLAIGLLFHRRWRTA